MSDRNDLRYMTGFGNECAAEAVPGTLPVGRNSPQRVAHGLYAEQISGTAFTAPRGENRRSWLYRIRPGAMHGSFETYSQPRFHNDFGDGPVTPDHPFSGMMTLRNCRQDDYDDFAFTATMLIGTSTYPRPSMFFAQAAMRAIAATSPGQ